MIRRVITSLAMQTANISVISLAISVLGLAGVLYTAPDIIAALAKQPADNVLQLEGAGILIVIFIVVRSIFGDVLNIADPEEKIEAGTSIKDTKYDFWHLLDKRCEQIFIIGQNLRTLFVDPRVFERLRLRLCESKILQVTIILALPKMMEPIDQAARSEFIQSVEELVRFYYVTLNSTARDRVTIRFHAGAMSLSALIRDPHDRNRGILTFTPKWATDREPGNRIFCVLHKWKNPSIFNKMFGHVGIMIGSSAFGLEAIAAELGVSIPRQNDQAVGAITS